MLDFEKKRKVRGILYSRVTIGVLVVLVFIVAHSTWSVWQKKRESEQLKNISMQNVEDLKTRDANLRSKIDRLQTDAGLEEEIRSKFSVAKADESVVVVVPQEAAVATSAPLEVSFWQKIWNFLKIEN